MLQTQASLSFHGKKIWPLSTPVMLNFSVSFPHLCRSTFSLELNFSVIINTCLYKFYTESYLPEISKETVILYQWKQT